MARTCNVQVQAIGFAGGSGWSAGGLVVKARVDGQFAEKFAGGAVDDANAPVVDEQDDVGSGEGSSDADVTQPAGDDAATSDCD